MIKNKQGKTSRPLFTDTPTLMHEIKTENLYQHCSEGK